MTIPVHNNPALSHAGRLDDQPVRRRQAKILGYAGLVPFVGLALLHLFIQDDTQVQAGKALVAYGAVIISFIGAWHWGAAISGDGRDDTARRMLFAVSPALLGWLAILLPLVYGLLLIISGLLLTLLADSYWSSSHAWYHTLRVRLTLVATLSLSFATLTTLDVI